MQKIELRKSHLANLETWKSFVTRDTEGNMVELVITDSPE